jgi:hypothetical protein
LVTQDNKIGTKGKTVYISFLMHAPSPEQARYEFELHSGHLDHRGLVGGIGVQKNNAGVELRNGKTKIKIGNVRPGVSFYVMRIDYKRGNDKARVYMNPPLAAEPNKPDAEGSNADMKFDAIAMAVFDHQQEVGFDEIRIGTTWESVVGTDQTGGQLGEVARLIATRDYRKAIEVAASHEKLSLLLDNAFKAKTPLLKTFHEQIGTEVTVPLKSGTQKMTIRKVSTKGVAAVVRQGPVNKPVFFTVDDLTPEERVTRLGSGPSSFLYVGLRELEAGNTKTAAEYFTQSKSMLGPAIAQHLSVGAAERSEKHAEKALNVVLASLKIDSSDGKYKQHIATAMAKEKYGPDAKRQFPPLVKEYVERYGETAFGREYAKQLETLAAMVSGELMEGLLGRYYDNKSWDGDPVLTRIDKKVYFDWKTESPGTGVPKDDFSTVWTGFLQPPKDGKFNVETYGDDKVVLIFDGKRYPNKGDADKVVAKDLTLKGGQLYPIEIRFYEGVGSSKCRLVWWGDGLKRSAIDTKFLRCRKE